MTDAPGGFYDSYASYKGYVTPTVGGKETRRFDAAVWGPGACASSMRFLEIGCGTGAFLAYLAAKGVTRFQGIDHDPALAAVVPDAVRDHFVCADLTAFLAEAEAESIDRVVALDVLEHVSATDALALVQAVGRLLAPGGRLVIKVPNASCPWGLQYQFGDLTHRTAFTPLSLKQLVDAAGLDLMAVRPHAQGSRRRMITDALVHRFLSWALLTPPDIWTANLVAVIGRR